MKRYIFLLVFLILLTACTKETGLKKTDTSFNTGFDITKRYSGSYYDKAEKRTLIYFADPVTAKSLKIFDDSGKLRHTVSLAACGAYLNDVDDITIFSPDTILVNSQYTNKIAFIGRDGGIWKKLDLNRSLGRGSQMYEVHSSTMTDFRMEDGLLFNCELRADVDALPKSDYDAFVNTYTNFYRSPYFVKISDVYGDVRTQYGFHLYPEIFKSPSLVIEPSFYTICNGRLLVMSTFSNKVFEVDQETLRKTNTFSIQSDYTEIGIKPIALTKENAGKVQSIVDDYAKSKGFIANVEYDAASGSYLAVVYHDTGKRYERIADRPFSLIWLDQNFKKKQEIRVLDKSFTGGFCIRTDKSVLFYSNQNSDARKDIPKVFIAVSPL